ncbi:GNAT family N-acetyltransferase [Streptomyces sp. NPDC044984]|uniref:GNAT family N-acetyltransferase n=1 Tax=Streptomyces sp. NPDC044984 TaxID=3154335 RepID=UPI0033CB11B8
MCRTHARWPLLSSSFAVSPSRSSCQEFVPWARMIADTYGPDRSEEGLAGQRAATALARALAVFDRGEPVAGASVHSRTLTVPGGVVPVAGIASMAVAPTHPRRGILTSMMRARLTGPHERRRETIAALRPSEAGIYGRYGYGPAAAGNRMRRDRRAMRFRPDTDFGDGAVRLQHADQARPLLEEIYDRVRTTTVGRPDRQTAHWTVRLAGHPHRRGIRTVQASIRRDFSPSYLGGTRYRRTAPGCRRRPS